MVEEEDKSSALSVLFLRIEDVVSFPGESLLRVRWCGDHRPSLE